jgi:hypothetical protein
MPTNDERDLAAERAQMVETRRQNIAAALLGIHPQLPPHADDVAAVKLAVTGFCGAHRLPVTIMPFNGAPEELVARVTDSDDRPHDDSASPRLRSLAVELETTLSELRLPGDESWGRVEMWSDNSGWDNSLDGFIIVVLNVMECEPPFDQYNRPVYKHADPYLVLLREN